MNAHAQLDPGAKTPYQMQVVLQVGANRVFTPLFQDQLERDVQNQLRLAFGDLAKIDVTRDHPLLGEIEAKGLDAALENWDALTDRATHFVQLDYVAGAYQIRTRYHDGKTGQAGAATRVKTTNDRAGVAAAIAGLIEASFSPIGTVTAVAANGKDVTLTLQGGELGVPMDRWVERGHVFAVSRIADAGGRPRAERIEWALLEVVNGPAKGVCGCRYHHRYQEDTLGKSSGTLGFRAQHLPTGVGAVKVQLLDGDDKQLKPLKDVRVRIGHPGDKTKPEETYTDKSGLPVTKKAFTHFAIVEVVTGRKDARGQPITPHLPVAVIEGRTAVARVSIKEDRESLAPLEVRREAWLGRAYDNVRLSSERARELSGLLNQSLESARDAGRKGLKVLEAEIEYLDQEAGELGKLIKEKKVQYDLREGQQQIDELRKKAKELNAFVDRIDGVLKNSAQDDKALGLHKLLERAKLFEAETEFDAAIRLYEQIVQANPEQTATIKAHLDKLKEQWKVGDADHARAREFIYQVWPTLDASGIGPRLDDARKALKTCENANDRLTPQKMLRANVAHTVQIKKQLETLKRRDSEDNRNQAKRLAQVSQDLLQLHRDATAIVEGKK
jgi:hypothetical protein